MTLIKAAWRLAVLAALAGCVQTGPKDGGMLQSEGGTSAQPRKAPVSRSLFGAMAASAEPAAAEPVYEPAPAAAPAPPAAPARAGLRLCLVQGSGGEELLNAMLERFMAKSEPPFAAMTAPSRPDPERCDFLARLESAGGAQKAALLSAADRSVLFKSEAKAGPVAGAARLGDALYEAALKPAQESGASSSDPAPSRPAPKPTKENDTQL